MNMMKNVREVVSTFKIDQIQDCINDQIDRGMNDCNVVEENEITMNILSRAAVVSGLMNQGMDMIQAMRELGRRMRLMQSIQ